MTPQYLAAKPVDERKFATLRPQHISLVGYPYLFAYESSIVRPCHTPVALRQAGSNGPATIENNTWRQRCPRASKHSSPLVWSLSWPPAPITHQSKNTSWSTQRRFRLSRNTPANISNSGYTRYGQAGRPVQPLTQAQRFSRDTARISAPLQKGGAA